MTQNLKKIIGDLKSIQSNSVLLYVLPKDNDQEGLIYKSLDSNFTESITHDLLNLFLQEQFIRRFNFVATLESFESAVKNLRPNLFDIKDDFNLCHSFFSNFNHIEKYTDIKDDFDLKTTNDQLQQLNEKLAQLKSKGEVIDYILYSNLDNQTFYCQDTDSDAYLLVKVLVNVCQELKINPCSLVNAMISKAKTLRAQLIMGTINSKTNKKSILLKLSQFGYFDFNRCYAETKIQKRMIRVSKFVQNNGSDWHCIFVESPTTNYLSISYTDFAQVKKGILTICRGDDKNEHIERNANWMKLAFSSIDVNKWFYPSKKWNATGQPISEFSKVEGLSPLPVDEFVRDDQAQINGILSEVVKDHMANVKSAFNKKLKDDYPEPLAAVIFQLLGTLISVYPEHQAEIKDFGREMEKNLLN
ncbi:hypothetical protein ABVC46_02200 [Lactobacillus crispatus]|uniref:Uncharacterized protein n=1 Tax=Lactobacillus crispatus TaxID=47770 RepID=A0AAW8WLE6_9LACO|nr:hypothetical protein [Lactobacillus crispatus]MDT9610239.1 hypothetical protein [Lactobacillus crispatus]MDT9617828.1 hypothetical protein [Lactobacillus crispatus]MDX5064746.1 hypothetical protein [Lactobacillus crispatus]MDX5106966.1 hypothetical protein [Lactobacillus crispatus]UAY40772.1 hypothetical protein LAE51_13895 [Lactobacillus crispatus]